eukprot:m.167605 g.167605  ORF g.167605 m.167605 type:complete len:69 (+) comp31467_c2_seq2:480-686(+)
MGKAVATGGPRVVFGIFKPKVVGAAMTMIVLAATAKTCAMNMRVIGIRQLRRVWLRVRLTAATPALPN